MPSAGVVLWNLAETSPSDHNLHSPDLILPPKGPLAKSPPQKGATWHIIHVTKRWPRIRGLTLRGAVAPTLHLSGTEPLATHIL